MEGTTQTPDRVFMETGSQTMDMLKQLSEEQKETTVIKGVKVKELSQRITEPSKDKEEKEYTEEDFNL